MDGVSDATGRLYDAVMVLGGNIFRTADGRYLPTTYEHSDEFGMLGGEMRVVAAVWMYMRGQANTFVFSTGTSEKTKAVFGPTVPTEAHVYREAFKVMLADLRRIDRRTATLSPPILILEEASQNTAGNLRECFAIIRKHGWRRVAVMHGNLQIARTEALSEVIRMTSPVNAELAFIGAEDIVRQLCPGRYDAEIDAAYATEVARKRIRNEEQGLADLKSGRYVMTEFQLSERQLNKVAK